ncbi:hypothetical protein BTA51_13880 [Hahella sp. CCB-MM4]|uniref:hypothetical protein n=1 Tax=Hahella sp. (strain CCB-MM4) TaxID=1926491 RepID=UPI000B9B5204|nr:hypothetical protein [Hahella sp. CCB-MM4]OZG72614.1 hypothetical protein BTA51_13880 [Hahella sp. CCB-MM4]
MNKYKVLLNGQNFLVELEGKIGRFGFLSNIFVEAENENDAEQKAVEMLRQNKTLSYSVKNERENPPMIYAEEIIEMDNFGGIETPDQGLTWYPEEES